MDKSDKKKNALKARDEFFRQTSDDSRYSADRQFQEKIKRIRHLSGTEQLNESYEGEFRKRSSSYGQAVSPNLSARLKKMFGGKPKPTSSSESISGKSPPSKSYLTPLRIPQSYEKSKGNTPSPLRSAKPSYSRQRSFESDSPPSSRYKIPSIGDDYYNMDHKYRGKALIFNHEKFQDDDLPDRDGAKKDVENITKTLQKLGFQNDDIEVHQDYSYSEISKTLDLVGQEDHTDNDLLMIFVLTHGEKDDRIHAHDHEYQVSKLWKPFTAEKCKTLAGKPKIFFIVACRGESIDAGTQITMAQNRRKASINTETDAALMGPVISYTIPVWADFLTVYSTVPGYYSYRDADDGTWYIKALSEEVNNVKKQGPFSFTDLLVKVNRKVAISYETFNENPSYHKKKQCPFISSTLTRLIKFEDKK